MIQVNISKGSSYPPHFSTGGLDRIILIRLPRIDGMMNTDFRLNRIMSVIDNE